MRQRRALRTASINDIRRALDDLAPKRIRVSRVFDGSLDLRVLSDKFADVEEPLEVVKATLAKAGYSLPARTLTFLKAPSELEADEEESIFAPTALGTPTWGDALLREPSEHLTDDRAFTCKVVAFWGLKGGVGRSTALAHIASILGRRMMVLAVDLDLDSPGLVATLSEDEAIEGRPRFEDLVRGAADDLPDDDLEAEVAKALRRGKDAQARIDVFGPAAADADFVKALLGPLAPSALYRGGTPTLRRLLRAAIRAAGAEIVLVDARSGYCDESAMTVLDLADEVVLFASPAPSTFVSMDPAIEALERNRRAIGRPRIVHLAAGMLPAGIDARTRILEELEAVTYSARQKIAATIETPEGELPPDVAIVQIDYTPRIVENEGRILANASDGYRELAARLVPPSSPAPSEPARAGWVKAVLDEADIPVPQAESEEDTEKLARMFTSTRDLHDFVRHDVCLVLGAKGTGKSYLRRMCLEHKDVLTRRSGIKALESTIFIDGYHQPRGGDGPHPLMNSELLRELDASHKLEWRHIWSALALGRTVARIRGEGARLDEVLRGPRGALILQLSQAGNQKIVLGLVRRLLVDPLALDETWAAVDRAAAKMGKTLTLLFDDLDIALGETAINARRRRAVISGLIDRMNNSWMSRRNVAAKIFLREDLFRQLGMEEEAKYATRSIHLRWSQEEIWRLVIRAMAVGSPRFAERLTDMSIDHERLEECAEGQWQSALALIWGERMGEGEGQTRSTTWAWKRLHDGADRMFPRAALWLLKYALKARRNRGIEDKLPLLDASALRDAMPEVSAQRLVELEKECNNEEKRRIRRLKGFDSYTNQNVFERALQRAEERDPAEALKVLKSLGIVESGARRTGVATVRIVDLYAFAPELKINRLGRR